MHSQLQLRRNPLSTLGHQMMFSLRQFWRFTDKYYFLTAIIIAHNGVTRQYRDSFLGILWTVLQPAVQIMVYTLIFARIMRFPMENYVLYLIGSLLVWQFMASTLVGACNSILSQGETIKRCIVSLTVFPLADVFRALYTYCIAFLVMYAYALIFLVPFHWQILLLPIALIPIIITVTALSMAIAFASPYIRDIGDVVTVILNVSFWLTPILYPITAMPENVRYLFAYNPFYIMLRPINEIVHESQIPDMSHVVEQLVITALTVGVSYIIYRICRKNFVYYL